MAKFKYPHGYKFNKLTVIDHYTTKGKNRKTYYRCRCECGKIVDIMTQHMDIQKSCGCASRTRNNTRYPKGYKFNDLTVLEYLSYMGEKGNHTFYKCQCKCGKIIRVLSHNINKQKSCGCASAIQKL